MGSRGQNATLGDDRVVQLKKAATATEPQQFTTKGEFSFLEPPRDHVQPVSD